MDPRGSVRGSGSAPGSSVDIDKMTLPAFVKKTWEMLSRPGLAKYISWNASGTTIVVHEPAKFASEVLPMFFKHRNFSSFVRQLNLYSFRKTGVDPTCREFINPLFRRDKPEWLPRIKRKNRTAQRAPEPHIDGNEVGFMGLQGDAPSSAVLSAPPHAGARIVSSASSNLRPHREKRGKSTTTSGSESVEDGGDASDDEDYKPSRSVAGRQAAHASASLPPPRISVPADRDIANEAVGSSGHAAAAAAAAGDDGFAGANPEGGGDPSDSVEELRVGRRHADRMLKDLVGMKERQALMERELAVLRARDESIRMAMETNATLQQEVLECRHRMMFLMQSMQKLYLLVWHLYSSYKNNGGQPLPEHRQELDAIASASHKVSGGMAAPIAVMDGSASVVRPSSSPAPIPSGSPIAPDDGSSANGGLGLGSFGDDGAMPFELARQNWRALQQSRHIIPAKRVRDAPMAGSEAGDGDGGSGPSSRSVFQSSSKRPAAALGSADRDSQLAALGPSSGSLSPSPSPPASSSSALMTHGGTSTSLRRGLSSASSVSSDDAPMSASDGGQGLFARLPSATSMSGVMSPSNAATGGRAGSAGAMTGGLTEQELRLLQHHQQQALAAGVASQTPHSAASGPFLGNGRDVSGDGTVVKLQPFPQTTSLTRFSSAASTDSAPGVPTSIGVNLAELANDQHVLMADLATTEDRLRDAARRLQIPHAPNPDSSTVKMARAMSGSSQAGPNGYGLTARTPLAYRGSPRVIPQRGTGPLPSAVHEPHASPAASNRGAGPSALGAPGALAAATGARSRESSRSSSSSSGGASSPRRGANAPMSEPVLSLGRSVSHSSMHGTDSHVAIAGVGLDGFGAGSEQPSRTMLRQTSGMGELLTSPAIEDDALSLGSLGDLDDVEREVQGEGDDDDEPSND